MKTYRIFDCTTIIATNDRFIFGFEWMAVVYCIVMTRITKRFHDFNDVSQEVGYV